MVSLSLRIAATDTEAFVGESFVTPLIPIASEHPDLQALYESDAKVPLLDRRQYLGAAALESITARPETPLWAQVRLMRAPSRLLEASRLIVSGQLTEDDQAELEHTLNEEFGVTNPTYATRWAGHLTTTKNPDNDLFTGIHLDIARAHDQSTRRTSSPFNLAINIGEGTRQALVYPVDCMTMCQELHGDDPAYDPDTYTPRTMDFRAFQSTHPQVPALGFSHIPGSMYALNPGVYAHCATTAIAGTQKPASSTVVFFDTYELDQFESLT